MTLCSYRGFLLLTIRSTRNGEPAPGKDGVSMSMLPIRVSDCTAARDLTSRRLGGPWLFSLLLGATSRSRPDPVVWPLLRWYPARTLVFEGPPFNKLRSLGPTGSSAEKAPEPRALEMKRPPTRSKKATSTWVAHTRHATYPPASLHTTAVTATEHWHLRPGRARFHGAQTSRDLLDRACFVAVEIRTVPILLFAVFPGRTSDGVDSA